MTTEPKTETTKLTHFDLRQFTGTENYYRHLTGLLYTDGVQYLCEVGRAYWLIEAIASYQNHRDVRSNERLQEFQLWIFKKKNSQGTLTLQEDTNCKPNIEQFIEFTDFPLDEISLYLCNNTIILTTEY